MLIASLHRSSCVKRTSHVWWPFTWRSHGI